MAASFTASDVVSRQQTRRLDYLNMRLAASRGDGGGVLQDPPCPPCEQENRCTSW